MQGKYFLDTNIIIYSVDHSSPKKQKIARGLISKALDDQKGIVSSQVIQEFINVALKKFQQTISPSDCKTYINQFLMPICEIFPSQNLYNQAIDISNDYQLNFYDALIITSAIQSQCRILYSEDLNDGQIIKGLKIKKPFN